uniref:Uncharacterized protein n=1 Tax=Glossina austeni TaxID=7395 RepID=A0A1A9V8W3_GLOAU
MVSMVWFHAMKFSEKTNEVQRLSDDIKGKTMIFGDEHNTSTLRVYNSLQSFLKCFIWKILFLFRISKYNFLLFSALSAGYECKSMTSQQGPRTTGCNAIAVKQTPFL